MNMFPSLTKIIIKRKKINKKKRKKTLKYREKKNWGQRQSAKTIDVIKNTLKLKISKNNWY